MNDERCLDRLPVRREAGSCGTWDLRRFAACERICLLIVPRQLSCLLIEGAQLDAGPEAAEGEPRVMRNVFDVVGVDCVVVVCSRGLED